MAWHKTVKDLSLRMASLVFAAVGGLLGVLLMAIMEGWLPIPIGVAVGLYVAVLLAYHNVNHELSTVRNERDSLAERYTKLATVAASSRNANPAQWSPFVEVNRAELVFNLQSLGNTRVRGIRCLVRDPAGNTTIAHDPLVGPDVQPDTTVWFVYPRDFAGAADPVDGSYVVRWECLEEYSSKYRNIVEETYPVVMG